MVFSVVIPFFNTPIRTLEVSSSSVIVSFLNKFDSLNLNKDCFLKLILVNDGSNICYNNFLFELRRRYCFEFLEIIYLENPRNLGRSFSRNLGLNFEGSDFVSFLDSDDEYSPNFFSTFFETYCNYPDYDFYTFSYKIDSFSNYRVGFPSFFNYNIWKYFCMNSVVLNYKKCNGFYFDVFLSIGEDIKFFKELIKFRNGLHTNKIVSVYNYDYKSYNAKFNSKILKIIFYFVKFNLFSYFFKTKLYSKVS
jgi:glycosyltransferase involved in cell wall biosynthesis